MKSKILPGLASLLKPVAWSICLMCFCAHELSAAPSLAGNPEIVVSGTVTSSDSNEPLPGVNIIIKGTTIGTATDADGKYSIATEKGAVLVFSFVGYASSEVTVGESTEINISLAPDLKMLGEIVVVGYSSQSKRSITGAVSSLTSKDMPDVSPVSIERSLQGKVPGVYISSEGTPGGSTMVRIRGFGTVNNNDPLYVIDGVPTKGNLTSLSPSDIESITVLKDASAASIYGNRAANGVVLVTTKKGTSGEPQLRVTFNKGVQNVNKDRFPDLVTPQQLADMHYTRQINGADPSNPNPFNHPAYGHGTSAVLPDFINPVGFLDPDGETIVDLNGAPVGNVNEYDLNDQAGDGVYQLMRANKAGTDWFDEAYQSANFTNVGVNYSGGSEKGTYYIGTEYFDQEGVIKHTNFKRYSARFNSMGRVKKWMRIGENMNITYSEGTGLSNQNENGVLSMMYRIPGIIPVYDERGNFAGNQCNCVGNARNPVAELYRNKDNKARIFRTFGNAYLEADIIEGLTVKTLIGIDYTTNNGTAFTALNPGDYESVLSNSFSESNSFNSAVIWTNTVNYSKEVGSHRINALVGMEYIENVFRLSSGARQSYVSDYNVDERYLSLGTGTQTNSGTGGKNNLASYFGKIDYSFSDKYLATLTLRRDGSSRFPENNRWGTFPAASLGWIISEESFFSSVKAISTLKLRAGWGQVGNQDIPDTNAANTFFGTDVNYASYSLNGANTAALPGFDKLKRGNPKVTWETTETINVGLDASLLRNSLTFSLDWYNRETKDMLVDIVQPATAGAAQNAFLNVGNVTNRGIDLGVNYTSERSKDLWYSIGANISTYKNTVNKLNSAPFYGTRAFDLQQMTITKEGEAISSFYGFVIDGIFKDQDEVDAHVPQDGKRPGTFRIRDVNGDDVINDKDRTVIGSPHPDFIYGFTVNIGYKNFELSVVGTGVKGNEIFNATRFFTDFWKFDGNKSTRILNAWTPENTDTNVPQLNSNEIVRESQESTYYIEDGSFTRIRSIQLNYNLPKQLLGNALTSAKIYVSGQNLFTWTKYSGLDPEVNLQNFTSPTNNRGLGVDRGAYPQARSFMVGILANF